MEPTDTRRKLLTAAYELMIAQGYSATGVGEICEAAGVSKGSFYHFFDTKEACAIAVLSFHGEEADAIMARQLDLHGLSGPEAAIEYIRLFEANAEDFFCDGCLIGTFALELAKTHPTLRKEVERQLEEFINQLESALKPLYPDGVPPGAPTTRELAEQMLVAIEGGVVLSKAFGDVSRISKAIRGFRLYAESLASPTARIAG